MKKSSFIITMLSTCLIGSAAFADNAMTTSTSTAPTVAPVTTTTTTKPCQSIIQACKAAGFTKGDKQGKGLMKDCVKKIADGETVTGVTADTSAAPACKAMIDAKRAAKKAMKQQNQAAPASSAPIAAAPADAMPAATPTPAGQ